MPRVHRARRSRRQQRDRTGRQRLSGFFHGLSARGFAISRSCQSFPQTAADRGRQAQDSVGQLHVLLCDARINGTAGSGIDDFATQHLYKRSRESFLDCIPLLAINALGGATTSSCCNWWIAVPRTELPCRLTGAFSTSPLISCPREDSWRST